MSEDRRRSPGQWAPWISDPDPPEEPMTREQIKAASAASKDLIERAEKTGEQKHDQLRKELVEDLLQARPQLTPEEAKKLIDGF